MFIKFCFFLGVLEELVPLSSDEYPFKLDCNIVRDLLNSTENFTEYLKPMSFFKSGNEIIVRGNLIVTNRPKSIYTPIIHIEEKSLNVSLSRLSHINSFIFKFNHVNYINSIANK